jgi:predicted site-specific integrase-resolvase
MYLTINEFAASQKPPVHRTTVERWIREGKLTYELTVSKRKRITGIKKV